MDIQVGEYVRTEVGIAKIIGIDDNRYIIDRITSIDLDPFILNQFNLWSDRWKYDNLGGMYKVKYLDKDIKSIVTKEQFESMSYKVGE